MRAAPAVVLVALCGRLALAAAGAREAADALYRAGTQALEGGDEAAALDDLERAQALYQHPKIALAEAMVLARMGQPAEAADLIDAALAQDLKPELQRLALSERAQLDLSLLRLTVEGDPPSEVSIDGEPFAALPHDRWVAPGLHTIRARAPGRLPFEAEVIGAAGEHQTVVAHTLLAPVAWSLPAAPSPELPLPAEPPARAPGRSTWVWWAAGAVVAGAAVVLAVSRGAASPHAATDLGSSALVFH